MKYVRGWYVDTVHTSTAARHWGALPCAAFTRTADICSRVRKSPYEKTCARAERIATREARTTMYGDRHVIKRDVCRAQNTEGRSSRRKNHTIRHAAAIPSGTTCWQRKGARGEVQWLRGNVKVRTSNAQRKVQRTA